jgi:hypothetical protein
MANPTWEETEEISNESAPKWEDTEELAPSDFSQLESGLRGAAQSVSYGTADELTAAGETAAKALFGGDKLSDLMDNYRKYRTESRADYKAAEEQNPATYLAGELGGGAAAGLLTGGAAMVANLGRTGLVTGAKELAKMGLKQGAAAGLGSSEGDLTKGEIGQAAADTAIGAGLGATVGAVLPTAVKGAGKALSATGDFLMEKSPNIVKKGKAAFKLAEKGVEVIGTKAEESLDKESRQAAKDIISAFRRQSREGSVDIGKALKSLPEGADFSKVMTEVEDSLGKSNMRVDDYERALRELKQFKDTTVKETVVPGLETAKQNMAKKMESTAVEAALLGEKVSFPSTSKSDNFLFTLKKSLLPSGEETASVLKESIPADQILKESTESFKNMDLQDLNNVKMGIDDLLSGDTLTSYGKKILQNTRSKLDETIKNSMDVPNREMFEAGNAARSQAYDAGNLIGTLSPKKQFLKDSDIKLQAQLLSPERSTTQKTVEQALSYGQKITPELKESIKDFPMRNQLLKDVKGEGGMFGGLINPKGIAIRTGEMLGKTIGSKPVVTTKDFTRKFINLPDNTIVGIANKMKNLPGAESLGLSLEKALQDAPKRDRLIWALSQQPAFREMVNKTEEDQTVVLPTLDVN